MMELSYFFDSPASVAAHGPGSGLIGDLVLHFQGLVEELVALESSISHETDARNSRCTYPAEQVLQLFRAKGMSLQLCEAGPLEAAQKLAGKLLALLRGAGGEVCVVESRNGHFDVL